MLDKKAERLHPSQMCSPGSIKRNLSKETIKGNVDPHEKPECERAGGKASKKDTLSRFKFVSENDDY